MGMLQLHRDQQQQEAPHCPKAERTRGRVVTRDKEQQSHHGSWNHCKSVQCQLKTWRRHHCCPKPLDSPLLPSSHPPISYWCFLLVECNQSFLTWKYGKHSLQQSTPLQKKKKAEQRRVRTRSKNKEAYDQHIIDGKQGRKRHIRENPVL